MMRPARLLARQIAYENRVFWRNPVAAFFTVAFPLILLAIFNLVFGGGRIDVPGGSIPMAAYFVPGILALSVVGACFTNVAMGIAINRDAGLLKRLRGTPLPAWALLGGKLAHAVLVALLLALVVAAAGMLFYGVALPPSAVPACLLALALGAATCCALGLAITAAIPHAQAASAIVQATVLPLLFISDVFIPMHRAPDWLVAVADIFPLRHFVLALQAAFNPFDAGTMTWGRLAALAAWLLIGTVAAVRFFRWEAWR